MPVLRHPRSGQDAFSRGAVRRGGPLHRHPGEELKGALSLNAAAAAGAAPLLVIGVGNPSRGDDAIGPLAVERLEARGLPGVELLTDFQLQVEHALDLVGRSEVVFIDAAASGPEPFSFAPVTPAADTGALTHSLTPAAVLRAFRQVAEAPLPAAFALAVRGYGFELGAKLSVAAAANLDAALEMLTERLATPQSQCPVDVHDSALCIEHKRLLKE